MQIIKDFDKARSLLDRRVRSDTSFDKSVEETVRKIIEEVKNRGDKALFEYTRKFDKADIDVLEVSGDELSNAHEQVSDKLIKALHSAAERINEFNSMCMQKTKMGFSTHEVGRKVIPLSRVGIYVPGGTAAYPSTVLMTALPARAAGVGEIVMTTPPQQDGTIPAATLIAAEIAKVDRIFKLGGIQAIAALAYGTESVPAVDKICGPGNIYVATAKRIVYGQVDIDGIQGPSEIVIIADETASPVLCAADLIAQAEHDPMTWVVLITTSPSLADSVNDEIQKQLGNLERQTMAGEAIDSRGTIVIVDDIDKAIDLSNSFAPEHLLLIVHNADSCVDKIHSAGCVFVNQTSPVVLGDYIAGPSHVLPTGGTARFSSPLSVDEFLKTINIVNLGEASLRVLGPPAIEIAEAEGLKAHARAIKIRLGNKD
jgi:histidinol dehydrogenase